MEINDYYINSFNIQILLLITAFLGFNRTKL